MGNSTKKLIVDLFKLADIQIDGKRAGDVIIKDERIFKKIIKGGSLGLGEAYMNGWWDANCLDVFFYKLIKANLNNRVKSDKILLLKLISEYFLNPQIGSGSFKVGKVHYDLGNNLYTAMLGKRLVYTCAYWKKAKTLDQAQIDKLDLVCKKLGLKKGMMVLDIGCGFGSFAKYAAEKYQVRVDGVTISQEQINLGKELCQGLPVNLEFKDYREISGKYDRIVSLGMFEHVGHKNYQTFFMTIADHLKADGLFLLHTIGANTSYSSTEPWLNKYIFPNSQLPTIATIGKALEGNFIMEDWHNFSADYDKTLMSWYKNFKKAWPTLRAEYDERFFRMWEYFLMMCAGSFRARHNQLWQIVLSRNGVPGGYKSIR